MKNHFDTFKNILFPSVGYSVREETRQILDEWRSKALQVVLVVFALVGLLSWGSAINNSLNIGQEWSPALWVYPFVYLGFILLAVFPRMDYRIRGWGFILLCYINAIGSFANLGLVGSGRLFLLAAPLYTTILIGAHAGMLTAFLSVVLYFVLANAARAGLFGVWLDMLADPWYLDRWGEAGMTLITLILATLVLLESFRRLVIRTLASRVEMNETLQQTAQKLHEREERLSLVMQAINDGVWDWDLRSNEVYFSPRWKSMLGYEEHEIPDRFESWEALLHPDDLPRALELIAAHQEGKIERYELEHRLRHKDGTYRWILARGVALRDGDGKPYRMLGSHTDITERRLAEDAQRESEGHMRSLMESAEHYALYRLIADPTLPYLSRVAFASPSMKELLGITDLSDISTWYTNIHPQDYERIVEANRHSFEFGESFDEEIRYLNEKRGGVVYAHIRSTPVFDENGKLTHFNGLVVDITANKQYEQAIQRQNAYLAALHETALGILGRLSIDELMESIVERAVSLIDATDGIFDLIDTERDELEVKYGTGVFRSYKGTYVKRGEGVSGKAWESGQQIVVDNYNTWEGRSGQFEGMPMGPAIGVPLKSGEMVVGVFGILRPPGSPAFDPEEIDLIGRFAQMASIALDNARLHTSLQEELTERKRMDEIVQNRLFFEKIVSDISTQFINLGPHEVDAGIQHALGTVGRFVGADRSYVFVLSEDGMRMTNTHEWCAQGIPSMQARIQDQPVEVAPWCLGKVKALEVVNVPSVASLSFDTVPDRIEWEQQGIQSLIVVPMVYQGAAIGFLGFDAVRSYREWSDENIALLRIVGEMFVNALEHKRAQAIQQGQYRFLELLATGGEFSETLHTLVRVIEEQSPGMLGLILLMDEDRRHLHIGASLSLPQDYVQSIEGLEIGPMVGSCGTACYTAQRVIVEDIASDPRWDGLRDLAAQYGLAACWSEPVLSASGDVLGTFAMYFHRPRAPSPAELRTIDTAAHLVGIAVEHRRAEQALRDSELRFRTVFEGAPIGISVTSLEGRLNETNRALQEMYGYTQQEFYNLHIADFTYPDDINPDGDLFKNQFVPGKIDYYQLEKRYFRKNGEVFWGRLSMSLARDEQGQPSFAIATTEDITEQKRAQQELQKAYETLEERVVERTRELSSLLEVSHRLTATLNLDVLLELILEELKLLIDYHGCALYTVEDDRLVARAHQGVMPFEDLSLLSFSVDNPLDRLVLERRQAVIVDDTHGDSFEARTYRDSTSQVDEITYAHIRSWMAVPLMVKDQVIGEIAFEHTEPNFFTPQHAGFALAVANQAAVMIENARLYAQAQEVAALEERSRLARELHDSVTQSLYSVTLYAEAAARLLDAGEHLGASEHLRELRDTAQEALREMRLLIFELRPLALEKSGLAEALHGRMEAVEARSGIKTHLQVEGEENIAFAEKVALYQIAQETLNNVLKHAHAANLWVSITFNEDRTLLEVADDGVGFELRLATESGGMGLPGIRERVQELAGKLNIESALGAGTRIYITIPRSTGDGGGDRVLHNLEKEG